MSRNTLLAALRLNELRGEHLTLGGGEPTVHPHFFDYLGLALAYNPLVGRTPVHVVTNGKRKDISLRLAAMAKAGLISAELSQDEYHDPISSEVVQAFRREPRLSDGGSDSDYRGIRTVTFIMPVGRAIAKGLADLVDGCCGEMLLVDPEGRLFACGCKSIQLGTIWAPEIPSDYYPEWAHNPAAKVWAAKRAAARED